MDLARHPLTDFEQRHVDVADDRGFNLTHLVKYYCELSHPDSHVTCYLDRQRTPHNAIAVMIHPETDVTPLHAVHGLTVQSDLRHGSNMRRFPKRLHTGTEPITYARLIQCADLSAFGRLLHALVADSTLRSRSFQPEGAGP
ncbi:hypothetical protein [Nonomuraea basaltis]|uniref:hypothetical protein n=1 Tax=Nonomuraea basaltis TaxID=2495887 RepID=UPI00110C47D6|nr:hypothetical protein [Nonomuraea basaltis]TMR88696.1 hypothetical protein EJK15_64815 [Nonomuraea basaltis]